MRGICKEKNFSMNIKTFKIYTTEIAIVNCDEVCISDVQTATGFHDDN
jgi:hypothetical protein